jgi:uncharacterized membrane protein YkvA (DUF1232 family)
MTKHLNERKEARGFLKGALMLIPNFLKLLFRLFKDPRVPLAEKALVIGTIVYVVSPLDFIPDLIPFVGQVDDLYLAALVILRLLRRSSDEVIYEHWDGKGDLVGLLDKIERASRYVLPKKIREILWGRVEIAPHLKGGLLTSPAKPESIEAAREVKESRERKEGSGR